MAERFSCARTSWQRSEPLSATASQVRRWVLVEQPGTWGYDAVLESALPRDAGEELRRRCRDLDARAVLIRRCGGVDDGGRRVFVASSGPGAAWLERFDLDAAAEVLDLDLDPLAEGHGVGGQPVEQPLLLTCTNGRHDTCCAEFGRGVALALDDHLGERAWECSHIGGDRFAANVVSLPHGIYYGRVTPESAVGIAHLADAGQLSLPHYRGRSVWPFDVQAAETMLRAHLGVDGIDDVVPTRRRREGREATVDLAVDGEHWRVELEVLADPREQRMTCAATTTGNPPRFHLRDLRALPAAGQGASTSEGSQ